MHQIQPGPRLFENDVKGTKLDIRFVSDVAIIDCGSGLNIRPRSRLHVHMRRRYRQPNRSQRGVAKSKI
jgi:hypothetical protein